MLMVELFTMFYHKTRYIPTPNADTDMPTNMGECSCTGRVKEQVDGSWMWKELWMQVHFLYFLGKPVLTSKTRLESVISIKTNNYRMLLYCSMYGWMWE